MTRTTSTRRGSALMMVMAIVVVLVALTVTLSTNTVARLQAERTRDDQVELLAASESAANETVAWMQSTAGTTVIAALPAHPEIINSNSTPEAQYTAASALSGAQSATSSTYTILPQQQFIPYGGGTPYGQVVGCAANMRNGCAVDSIIVCLQSTPAGKTFPEGSERYLVFATATKGDKVVDAARFQRRRVMTVVAPMPTQVFKQSMYAISSYDVGGSAGSDSWNGTSTYVNNATSSTHHGDVKSGGTVTTSGSSSIDGTIYSNVKLSLPTLDYNPPSGASSLGRISSNTTLSGGNTYRASSMTGGTLTVSGSGTVSLYVDGPLNLANVTMAAGSTAKLVIYQGNYASSLGSTSFNLGGLVGDIKNSGSGGHPIWTSANDSSIGPDDSRLQIYSGYTGSMTFNGNGAMAGIVYAPQANIQMNGIFQFFGAVIADGFSGRVNGTFNFHYDDRLGSMSIPMNPQYSAKGWNIYNVAVSQN